ncbi:MAG: Gfo/Idh/MocA family oxidoreductase [Candidatus Latescibacterota bacterium]
MEVPRIAVVGLGGFAQSHLRYVEAVERAGLGRHVAQVAIPADQEAFAARVAELVQRGIAVYPSLRVLLAEARDQVDVLCIPTGIPLHRAMTVAALEAGCHCLVEKPAAGAIQDVDAMLAAVERAGRLCAVGYQHVYQPEMQRVKEWICQGRLGRVQEARGFGCWPRAPQYYGRNGWAGRLAVGDTWVLDSPHNNALAHAVNLLCWMACDQPHASLEPVAVQAELYRANAIESADTAVLRVRTREGAVVFFAVSHCTEENVNPLFAITGEKGRLEVSYEGHVRARWSDGTQEEVRAQTAERQGVLEDVVLTVSGVREHLACPLRVTRAQTLCICGSFESSAVHELPAGLRTVDPGSGAVVVRGMSQVVQRAFEEGALFSELGVEWARAGNPVSLEGYTYFPTFRRRVGE